MSDLSGNLASFGLRQVLRFLAETAKTGELHVTSDENEGRVLLQSGSVAYATRATGDDTIEELDALLARYEAGGYDRWAFGGDADHVPATLEEVLEEQLTEVLYDFTLLEHGSFAFTQAPTLADATGSVSFTVEHTLGLVDARIEAWRRIRRVIPSDESLFRLAARLPNGDAEVTLPASQWTLLAALGGEASVTEVAATLDVYPFHAARKFADLVEAGLLQASDGAGWDRTGRVAPAWASDDRAADGESEWDFAPDADGAPEIPRLEPTTEPVMFSKKDLSREEMDEIIRNIGRGIFPD
jgi:hypothetical protein